MTSSETYFYILDLIAIGTIIYYIFQIRKYYKEQNKLKERCEILSRTVFSIGDWGARFKIGNTMYKPENIEFIFYPESNNEFQEKAKKIIVDGIYKIHGQLEDEYKKYLRKIPTQKIVELDVYRKFVKLNGK